MEDRIFDEMIGRWVTPQEYDDFIYAMMEDDDSLKYPEYNLRVIQDIANERNNK